MNDSPGPSNGPLKRIVVVGSTGSGKTTLARQLSVILGVSHVELDALHWDPRWTPASTEVFRLRVERALRDDSWVVDGNYGKVRDIVWSRAEMLVWLDYPLAIIYWRLLGRTIARVRSGKELWNGNRERLCEQFLSRDSIFLWALKTYHRRRKEYPALFQRSEYANLTVVRHRSPRDTERWLRCVRERGGDSGPS